MGWHCLRRYLHWTPADQQLTASTEFLENLIDVCRSNLNLGVLLSCPLANHTLQASNRLVVPRKEI